MTRHQPDAPSPTLDDLAERFNDLHKKVGANASNALVAALDAGDVLIAARSRVPKGAWNQWLRSYSIPVSTAALYVQLAQNRSKIETEIDRFGELSLRAARRLVADPRAPRTSPKPHSNIKEELAQARRKIAELQAELTRLKATRAVLVKPTQLFARAVLLAKSIDNPDTGASDVEAFRNEAIGALSMTYKILLKGGVDINSISVVTLESAQHQHQRAA